MYAFEITAPITAVLSVPAGRIRITADAERSAATVEVRPSDRGRARDVKSAEQTEVGYDEAGGLLRVVLPAAANRLLSHTGSVEVALRLPAGSAVEAKAAAAEFRSTGRLGDLAVEGAQGPVQVAEAASARIRLASGDIEVGRLGGPAELSTRQGSIRIGEAVDGELVLSTQQGDITVTVAPEASATLDARTSQGRIGNSLRNTEGAAAGLTIRATTVQGDITARSL
ncbi:DUF4097 family beta strand repeat-containing protein [Phaeacidiphilus oryzae]|uniref:DUF4097 family beta strand repeat-containing protein n=1 Tax=Phaeacidiphilus oryzae TaxID=348818 RepID=UPI000562FFEA|nr:DUF4097 family beta strand repeat-containing protein [Phaeacidiphilus oryzae]